MIVDKGHRKKYFKIQHALIIGNRNKLLKTLL